MKGKHKMLCVSVDSLWILLFVARFDAPAQGFLPFIKKFFHPVAQIGPVNECGRMVASRKKHGENFSYRHTEKAKRHIEHIRK
jgi:hypothetical protein